MKILHVNKYLYPRGGAEGYMADIADLQRRMGHEVAFFGMQHPANPEFEFAAYFPSYLELDPPPKSLRDKARAAGRMMWSTTAARGVAAAIEKFRPDVVHLHNIYHHLSPSILRPLARSHIPSVMTLHDYKLACPTYHFLAHGEVCEACLGGRFHNAVRRRCKDGSLAGSGLLAFELAVHTATRAYDPVGLFVCPSRFLAEKMIEAGVFPDRMRELPHFVDPSAITTATAAGQGAVYAGRLSVEKGVDTLIEAIGKLASAQLDIAGDGPERDSLVALARVHAPDRVHFHGRLAQSDLHRLIRSAAVTVLPSRCYENQPMIVLEAFACGSPVLGTRLGGVPEIIEPGFDGALVAPNDPDELATVLSSFLDDPQRAFSMGMAARAKVEERFSPDRHLAGLEALYAEAAEHVG